jgi:hypothetical protein
MPWLECSVVEVVPMKSNRQELLLSHNSRDTLQRNRRSQLDLVHGKLNSFYSVLRARVIWHCVRASMKPYASASSLTVSNIFANIVSIGLWNLQCYDGVIMWFGWGRKGLHSEFWWGNGGGYIELSVNEIGCEDGWKVDDTGLRCVCCVDNVEGWGSDNQRG